MLQKMTQLNLFGYGLRTMDYGLKRDRSHQTQRGQIAVAFVVVMAFILVLIRMTINVGQMSQVRAETANAADAGALAAASWMASSQNEVAWIARKQQDAMTMIEALYLLPFAPDGETRAYANALWDSLVWNPLLMYPLCEPGNYSGCGPNSYLKHVANGTMLAGWAMSGREFATAAINNMIIRAPTGETYGQCGPGEIETNPSCIDRVGSIFQRIVTFQKRMYDDDAAKRQNEYPFRWNNGWPVGDRRRTDHQASFWMGSSTAQWIGPSEWIDPGPSTLNLPKLVMDTKAETYYQLQKPKSLRNFPCTFKFQAIANTFPSPSAPLAKIPLPWPEYSLAVSDQTTPYYERGSKYWDFRLENLIPSINQLTMKTVDACGINALSTPSLEVVARRIENGVGEVKTRVTHKVQEPVLDAKKIPTSWRQVFPFMRSEAVARFTTSSLPPDAWTQPSRNAFAELKTTK